ncbi:MAG TPA: L,D-transpeptidase family protein [Chitinophagaceae bacterium]|nr:L,D-transpeptidase family protein [Chitinophagaceae bacterium]
MNRLLSAIVFLLLVGCRQPHSAPLTSPGRDTSITVRNAFSERFLDSLLLEQLMRTEGISGGDASRIRDFYNRRNYQYAWFFPEGLADYTTTFLEMQNDYIAYSGDSSLANPRLQLLVDTLQAGQDLRAAPDSLFAEAELLLTRQFFRYARRAYQGKGQLDARELDWYIPRKKIDPAGFLDSLIRNRGRNLSAYEPVNRQYRLLKDYLVRYQEIENSQAWHTVPATQKSLRLGDSAQVIRLIRQNLRLAGDLAGSDSSSLFDDPLREAVKHFQHRHGLAEDGVAGPGFFRELNILPAARIRQLLINMERIRWVPREPATDYLLVNIPEFRLHVFEKGDPAWSMDVVVGQAAHQTVIFNANLRYVVFSPYWNVPASIVKKEIVPAMQRNPNYLTTNRMERFKGGIRQRPGPNNALGLVKFLFPNNYSIYLHDTPAKSLFGETSRAFSHGCIRLGDARKLAGYLLRSDPAWTDERVTRAMHAGKEQWVTLKEPVPVFIGYFTAWVDPQGQLNFRRDIYDHDARLAKHLFGPAGQ